METLPITIAMLTKNSQRMIQQVLAPLSNFDQVLILDTGSTDNTIELAKTFSNVHVFETIFDGFGSLRNKAATLARNDWIFALDSDEVLSAQLLCDLAHLELDPYKVYSFPFHNYYNNRWIKCCGWYPDRHTRLYNRNYTSFSAAEVHEGLLLDQVKEHKLKGSIDHYSYTCTADFLTKMQRYSDLFAQQHQGKKSSSFGKAIGHGFFAFFKNYFLQSGLFYGTEGFVIAYYNANTTFYKYLKLAEVNQKLQSQNILFSKK